jgi:hypothetical protein
MKGKCRGAIAMLELIFAIVVMGIALMSAPMLLSTSAKSVSVGLQQEGINEAVSRVVMVLSYPWDQNDVNDSCIPPVLKVSNGDSELEENGTTGRRYGVPPNKARTFFVCGGGAKRLSATAIGKEENTTDDMDDFSGSASSLVLVGGGGDADYVEQTTVNIATTVSYIDDSAAYNTAAVTYAPGSGGGGGSTNIKRVDVTLSSSSGASELQKSIKLSAFACNIGAVPPSAFESRLIP